MSLYRNRKRARRCRGAAMLLVLIAVAMCTILALSFLASQEPTAVVASNIDRKTQARQIAESALKMAIDYVNEDADWRSDKTSGLWMSDVALDGGTFTLTGTDEDDGDLANDDTQPVLLTVLANYRGVTHRVSARVTPAEEQEPSNRLLLVVSSDSSPAWYDQAKQALFESWGYTVTLLDDSDSQASYDDAVAVNDVVYISESVSSGQVNTKLRDTTLGVVSDEGYLHDDFGFTTGDTSRETRTTSIDIVDNSHPITSGLSVGSLTILSSSDQVRYVTDSLASGVTVLADRSGGATNAVLMAADTGDTLRHGQAAGRRVMFGWDDGFNVNDLNSDGLSLLRKTLDWAAGASSATGLSAKWHNLSSGPRDLGDVDWSATPDLTTTETQVNWPSTGSSWFSGLQSDDFAVELSGSVTVPTTGTWTFYLDSDDGSELVIDGATLIENDGLHGMRERSGSRSMTAGESVPIRVRFFERGGGAGLILSWSGPGQSKQVVPASAFASAEEETSGETPTLLALYDFEQVTVAPTLAARWRLDEVGAGYTGAVSVIDDIELSDDSIIDAYDASAGPYGGANQQLNVRVFTNTTSSGDVDLNDSTVYGDVIVGAGGNPSSVIDTSNGASITGETSAQSSNNPIPTYGMPSGNFGSNLGNERYNGKGNSETWSSNKRFNDLTIRSNATITISGHVQVLVQDDFEMDKGKILLEPGASLVLWVGSEFKMDDGSVINDDTTRPGDVQILLYGDSINDDFTLDDNAMIVGTIHSADDVVLKDGSAIYGSLTNEDDLTLDDSSLHLELSTAPPDAGGSASPTVAADDSERANDGTVHGNPAGGVAGQHGTAFEFDGNGDYVEIPHDDSYLMQGGTFSVWFKTDKTSGRQGLFSKDSTSFDTGGHFSVFLDGNRIEVRMQSTSQSYYVYSPSGSISTGQWYHIMFAWGEEGMVLYLDGVLVDSNEYTGGLGTTSGGIGNYEPIVLGANAWQSDDLSATPVKDYFEGCLDDLRIFNERLSEAQAMEIYNGADEPSPFQSKSIVEDTSGFGEPLTLSITQTDAVTWSAGSLTFDDDAVATSLVPASKLHDAIEATGEFSIEVLLTRAAPGSTASPSRIVEMSEGSSDANFVLGQDGPDYEARVRDSSTGGSGALSPDFVSTTDLNNAGDTHIVLSYKDGEVSVFIDGALDESNTAGGILNNWESDHDLLFGGTLGGGSYWRGTLKRVAIYDRGFDTSQAGNVYNRDEPGLPGSQSGSGVGKVQWDEED